MKVLDDGPTLAEVSEVVSEKLTPQVWLEKSAFKEILGSDRSHKSLFVLLEQPCGERGVLLLNKTSFPEDSSALTKLVQSGSLTEISRNDIFGSYDMSVPADLNLLKTTLIFPATDKIIAKYRSEEKFIIRETAEDYQTITKEYIQKYQMNLQWVYNILSKEAEADKIIFEDPDKHNGFLLAPDLKWDGKTMENMYVLAIAHRRGIQTLRDLTADDIPLLENIRDRSLATIQEKYGIRPDQVRAYFHYQPSFYHLHVHFVALSYEAPASSTLSAILLDDVINNLSLMSDYYKKATLSFTRKQSDKLLQMFREAGRCKE